MGYKDFIGSGEVDPRPGVLRMFREAKVAGLKVAVCSASNKESVIHVLTNLLGEEIFEFLDLFMAGDDVANKKPDPEIYNTAAERLGLTKDECIIVEDSGVGNMAAVRAGMRCVITYTDSTRTTTSRRSASSATSRAATACRRPPSRTSSKGP